VRHRARQSPGSRFVVIKRALIAAAATSIVLAVAACSGSSDTHASAAVPAACPKVLADWNDTYASIRSDDLSSAHAAMTSLGSDLYAAKMPTDGRYITSSAASMAAIGAQEATASQVTNFVTNFAKRAPLVRAAIEDKCHASLH